MYLGEKKLRGVWKEEKNSSVGVGACVPFYSRELIFTDGPNNSRLIVVLQECTKAWARDQV